MRWTPWQVSLLHCVIHACDCITYITYITSCKIMIKASFPGSLSHSLVGTITQLSLTSASASQNAVANSSQCVALPLLCKQTPP